MNQIENKMRNYVIFPRSILSDFRNGELTIPEFIVLCYLRLGYNPYGKVLTSLENIRSDMFSNKVGKSYINKIVLSLKSKKYLHFDNRTGRKGSFEVRFGDCITPEKKILTLDKYFSQKSEEAKAEPSSDNKSEDSEQQSLSGEALSQKLKYVGDWRRDLAKEKNINSVRGSYNDKENDIN